MTNHPLLGTWKLRSLTVDYLDTGDTIEPYGAHPCGYLTYGTDGRMQAIIVHENRKAPGGPVPTDAEMIALFAGMGAYAGGYTIDGNRVSHHVDVSWIQSWTGTMQVREFQLEGDQLRLRSLPAPDPLDGRQVTATAVWTKLGQFRSCLPDGGRPG
jgi:hypothetical protein